MPLPDLIEIVPPAQPLKAEVTVPGSKSITNRALILAALSEGETVLRGALWSEDTEIMVDCLQDLGFMINVAADPREPCNRTITVYGQGGAIPPGGTETAPVDLFVGNAGTVARFFAALLCLGDGVYRLHGAPRMHERPQAALFAALRELGCRIDARDDRLPAAVHGQKRVAGSGTGHCSVSVAESSQFASALLLVAGVAGWQVKVVGANADELPYVEMTRAMVKSFPRGGGDIQIEPDASSGSYFWTTPGVRVAHWPESGWQIDARFPAFLPLPPRISRRTDLGDSIMTAIVLAPLASQPVEFTDLGRLRVQECERVVALRTELARCGARVVEDGDTLTVYPSELHGAEVETYNDHRMAMSFATLALKVPGIRLRNPACVRKTFPNFFQKLAAPAPFGLGVGILDANGGRPLTLADLFAD
jgi:3-phosphoshikimate 1-carboxyvinyltransferase